MPSLAIPKEDAQNSKADLLASSLSDRWKKHLFHSITNEETWIATDRFCRIYSLITSKRPGAWLSS